MVKPLHEQIRAFLQRFGRDRSSGWREYTSEVFRHVKWTWRYADEPPHPAIVDLHPACPACGGEVSTYRDNDKLVMFCPACDDILDTAIATDSGYQQAIRGLIDEQLAQRYGMVR